MCEESINRLQRSYHAPSLAKILDDQDNDYDNDIVIN